MHVAAFGLPCPAAHRIVRTEIPRPLRLGALGLADEAIEDLHPLSVADNIRCVGHRLGVLDPSHTPLELRRFGERGGQIGTRSRLDSEVAEYLDRVEERRSHSGPGQHVVDGAGGERNILSGGDRGSASDRWL